MRRGRFYLSVIATGAVMLIGAGSALSATPRQIYADLAQHGKLTQHYSAADLARAAHDATLEGYGGVGSQTSGPAAQAAGAQNTQQVAAAQNTQRPSAVLGASVPASGTLPFTGMQLGVYLALGLALLAGGLLLRRFGRADSRI
jgi:hypothetical protein